MVAEKTQTVGASNTDEIAWFSQMLAFWEPNTVQSGRNLGHISYKAGVTGSEQSLNTSSFVYKDPSEGQPPPWSIAKNAMFSVIDAWDPEHSVMTNLPTRSIQSNIPQVKTEIGLLTYVTWGSAKDWEVDHVIVTPYRNGFLVELDLPSETDPTKEWLIPILRTYLVERKLIGNIER